MRKTSSSWRGRILLYALMILLGSCFTALPQHITGTYTTSAPEANLFFLNPAYLNPACGSGVLGIGANPAALTAIKGRSAAIAFGLPQSSSGRFNVQVSDSTDVYSPIYLETKLGLEELGGLAAIGFGQQMGRWRWGIALMQPRRGGVTLEANGSIDLSTHFQIDQSITPNIDPTMPVPELPVTWEVDTHASVTLSGKPAQLYLSTLPIIAGVAYKRGPLSLGVGFTYYHIRSSRGTAQLNTHLSANAVSIGTPYGIDPISQQPWTGSIQGNLSLEDDPLQTTYKIDVSGNRFAVSCGGQIEWKSLALGGSYAYALRGNIRGRYSLTTIETVNPPDETQIFSANINWSATPKVSGTVDLKLANFQKDTTEYKDTGRLSLGGVHTYSAGMHFFFLGAFVGGEIPERAPDLSSFYAGIYVDFPLPWLPVQINAGFINRVDGVRSEDSFLTPYRVVTHAGMGMSVRLPLNRWLQINDRKNWLRFGIRSSLASLALKSFAENGKATFNKSLPSIGESLSMSIGLEMPL